MYKIVEKLAGKLQHWDLLGALYEKLIELPQPYEEQHVRLIQTIADATAPVDGNMIAGEEPPNRPLGLTLLWEAVLGPMEDGDDDDEEAKEGQNDDANVSSTILTPKKEVSDMATDAVVILLTRRVPVETLAAYLQRCIAVLKAGRRVCPALHLLHKLCEAQPHVNYDNRGVTREQLLYHINKQDEAGIVSVVIEDLRRYRKQAHGEAKARGLLDERGVVSDDGDIITAVLTHDGIEYSLELNTRLAFLRYVTENCGPELKIEPHHLDELWQMMVVQSMCKAEMEQFFGWLPELVPEDPITTATRHSFATKSCISQDTAWVLFRDYLAPSDGSSGAGVLGLAAYHCLQRFFMILNGWEHRLALTLTQPTTQQPQKLIVSTVMDFHGLEGLEAVWQTYLTTKSYRFASSNEST